MNFIIGMPKCATTSVAKYLETNDQFCLGGQKEHNFFSSDIPSFKKNATRKLSEYESIFDSQKICVDVSVNYCFSDNAAMMVKDLYPDARIVLIMRRPRDYLKSQFLQLRYMGYEAEHSINRALFKESLGRKTKYVSYHKLLNYKEIIERWAGTNLLVVKYEDVVEDPGLIVEFFGGERMSWSMPEANQSASKSFGRFTYFFRRYRGFSRTIPSWLKAWLWKLNSCSRLEINSEYTVSIPSVDKVIKESEAVFERL